jgi:hypothetical protein
MSDTPAPTAVPTDGLGPTASGPAEEKEHRNGRKRLFVGGGVLLGIGALATAAAFTDFALLDLGTGGLGGESNGYNIQVSTGQEPTVGSVARWVEANPDAEAVTIPGSDSLSPGGGPLTVRLPVRNASEKLDSTLSLTLENTTENPSAADRAYTGLLRFSYAEVDDASSAPAQWKPVGSGVLGASGSTSTVKLGDLAPESGRVVVLRISLADGADQEATNAANGGGTAIQARFDGSSR